MVTVLSSRVCCCLPLLQHCPCTLPFTEFPGFPVDCALCLLPEHLGGCSAMAWETQMWAYAEIVCNKHTAVPWGHLPKTDHMNRDDAIRPHLMVLMCEMGISQIKQQPENCAWLLTQRSHTENRYERHVKMLWQSWVWHSQKLPHHHHHLCPGQAEHPSWGYCRCLGPFGQDCSTLDNAYLQHASLKT